MRNHRFIAWTVGIVVLGLVAGGSTAGAAQPECQVVNLPPKKAIYTSNSYTDPLATAIAEATAGDTLQVIGVCHGNWYLDKNLTITGQSNSDTLVGEPASTHPVLEAGWDGSRGYDLSVKHLTITGGQGGVRASTGTLSILDSVITGNHAGYRGGGIDTSGPLVVIDSIISDNSASLKHGGIATYGGRVTLINTTVSGNTAHRNGGIGPVYASLTLINSTVNNNVATQIFPDIPGRNGGDYAGGIWVLAGGHVDLIHSTVAGNSNLGIPFIWEYGDIWWVGHGGGIYNAGVVTLTNSVVTGNTAFSGGGIYNDQQGTVVLNGTSTVSGNTPDDIAP